MFYYVEECSFYSLFLQVFIKKGYASNFIIEIGLPFSFFGYVCPYVVLLLGNPSFQVDKNNIIARSGGSTL
jgi:hypothetical protein